MPGLKSALIEVLRVEVLPDPAPQSARRGSSHRDTEAAISGQRAGQPCTPHLRRPGRLVARGQSYMNCHEDDAECIVGGRVSVPGQLQLPQVWSCQMLSSTKSDPRVAASVATRSGLWRNLASMMDSNTAYSSGLR